MLKENKLTQEDLDMIEYFWEEKQDPTRWKGWADRFPELKERFPELICAWEKIRVAERTMDAVVKNLSILR